jgi:hypothetical protein
VSAVGRPTGRSCRTPAPWWATPPNDTLHTCQLLDALGSYLRRQGELSTAIAYHTRATTTFKRLRGSDHPAALGSRNNLAHAYQSAGDLGRSIALFEVALTDCERVLGPDHPTTRIVRQNLDAARNG